jgi:hypothetical protein
MARTKTLRVKHADSGQPAAQAARCLSLPLAILLALGLAACAPSATRESRAAQEQRSAATQAALLVDTEIARASFTPEPSATLTLVPPSVTPSPTIPPTQAPILTVTPQPGLAWYANPDVPDYVFHIDPARWEKDPSGKTSNLTNKSIAGCRIEAVEGHGLGPPKRLLWQDWGFFRWEILDYGAYAYAQPVLSNEGQGGGSFLQLAGYGQDACRSDQEQVLQSLLTSGQAAGETPSAPFRSPTPRPAMEGFDCPNTPRVRIRVGDEVSVVTDGLWLRSAPRADDSTRESKFLRYAPFTIRVIDGPVCEKYVYWRVEIVPFGEGSQATRGWFAEGDPSEYYLAPVK